MDAVILTVTTRPLPVASASMLALSACEGTNESKLRDAPLSPYASGAVSSARPSSIHLTTEALRSAQADLPTPTARRRYADRVAAGDPYARRIITTSTPSSMMIASQTWSIRRLQGRRLGAQVFATERAHAGGAAILRFRERRGRRLPSAGTGCVFANRDSGRVHGIGEVVQGLEGGRHSHVMMVDSLPSGTETEALQGRGDGREGEGTIRRLSHEMTFDPQLPACRFGACISLQPGERRAHGLRDADAPQRLREGVQSVDRNGATTGSGWLRDERARVQGRTAIGRMSPYKMVRAGFGKGEGARRHDTSSSRQRRLLRGSADSKRTRTENGVRSSLLHSFPPSQRRLSSPPLLHVPFPPVSKRRLQAHENGARSPPPPPHSPPLPCDRVQDMPEHRLRAHENGGFSSSLHPPSFHSFSLVLPRCRTREGRAGRDNARRAGGREQPARMRAAGTGVRAAARRAREGEEGVMCAQRGPFVVVVLASRLPRPWTALAACAASLVPQSKRRESGISAMPRVVSGLQ
ncbi:hypothetical protein DFH09DRAFT_1097039 [Mycena vulgaris]|nr:hypothetical protein DFH09DRAFT_1097039 [Mycena vulgaris]